jgi:hypothetical protein
MKRLLLTIFLGLTCAQQICANDTLNHALQIAGTQLISAKNKFDNSSLIAQATIPLAAGLAVGLCRNAIYAGYAHTRYNVDPEKQYPFGHTTLHGGRISTTRIINEKNIHEEKELFSGLTDICKQNMFWFGLAGILYSFYKNTISDSFKITAGSLLAGFTCNTMIHNNILYDLGTKFIKG